MYTILLYMKNTSGASLAAGGGAPIERFQIANIISFSLKSVLRTAYICDVLTDSNVKLDYIPGCLRAPSFCCQSWVRTSVAMTG
jgi:hypothetical protein